MENKIAKLLKLCIKIRAHLPGKLLHARILSSGISSNTFLANRLLELYSKCNNPTYAHALFSQIPTKNIYSSNTMLMHYCNLGDLEGARKVFDEMPERDVASWNNLISLLVRFGWEEEGLRVFDEMVWGGFRPTRFTLASVFRGCSEVGDLERGMQCHGLAVKVGVDGNVFVGEGLLSMYAKCGAVCDAVRVFEGVVEPSVVTFTRLIGGLGRAGRVFEALDVFRLMLREKGCVDCVVLSSVLGICSREELSCYDKDRGFSVLTVGKQVHVLVVKLGFDNDLHLCNSLLNMYAKNGEMDSAEEVFTKLPMVNVVSWNVMIAGYGQTYEGKKAKKCFQKMMFFGLEPNDVTFSSLIAASVKAGDVEYAHRVVEHANSPCVMSWNSVLSGYFLIGNHTEVIKMFSRMQIQNVKPDRTTFATVLGSYAEMELIERGREIHAAALKADLFGDLYVPNGLIVLYSKCAKMDIAKRVFERIPELDVVCWNSILSGFLVNSEFHEVFSFFKQMRASGMSPTNYSYATLASCCANLSSWFLGKQVHAQVVKGGFMEDVFVGSAVVEAYCRCGDVDEGRKIFNVMPSKNTVTWNEMLHGYAQNGRGDEAVCLYRDMIEISEKPDSVTFVAVLTACSHLGWVEMAVEIFDAMQKEYGIEPELDHYVCIINALGRAGRFCEVELLLDKMPYKDHPMVWEVLLGTCRVHAHISLAKRAAKELYQLAPKNPASHVLLANIYTALGKWDEAHSVRDLMSEKQVMKNPGYSWTDHNTCLAQLDHQISERAVV